MFEWRHQYDEERDLYERELTDIDCGTESLVQQQFQEDADINVLVRRFGLVGEMPAPVLDPAYYGDVADIPDLRTALERVKDAQDRFMTLPAGLRARFLNSPALLYDFISDPDNADEAVRLGLLVKAEPAPGAEPAPVEPTSSSAAAA